MTNQAIINLTNTHIMDTYARFPLALARGEGSTLYDAEGKAYLDFTSGLGVSSVGYAHPRWVAAVTEQAGKLAHTCNLFYTEPAAVLAKRLCALSGMERAFLANSGAEANEGAIKLARKYSKDKYGPGRSTIVALNDSFHGRTITTLMATGQEKFHRHFDPFTPGFIHVPANDIDSLLSVGSGGTLACALLLEPVQGEGGVIPLDAAYLQAAEKLCRERDWLLILDEVQTGVYRTGTPFAYQQLGITPDVVTFAKGIGGGLPLGGFLAGAKCAGTLGPGDHGTTYGGNPIACAAALAVLDILVGVDVASKAKRLREGLKQLTWNKDQLTMGEPRGLGLMMGVPVKGAEPKELVLKAIGKGLLTLTAGHDVWRFLPPLTIGDGDIDRGLAILREVIK
jgi:acetylornithine/N-succinyldiaminopimelate aminotransferase